jgi:hypothetical protein
MVYDVPSDVAETGQYVPAEEFRRVLENAPAGLFTFTRETSQNGMNSSEYRRLPGRTFRDGSFGPEPGESFGRKSDSSSRLFPAVLRTMRSSAVRVPAM